jgi:hypothetical protein
MPAWNIGDRVQVVSRPVTEDDRKKNRYFEHMAGLTGTIQSVYAEEIAVQVDIDALSDITADVHLTATQRMRQKFVDNVSDEQRRSLTKEELEFNCHYVLLVQGGDLVSA